MSSSVKRSTTAIHVTPGRKRGTHVGKLGIGATRSRRKRVAHLTPSPAPAAHFEHLPPEAAKTYKVFTEYRGTKSELNLKHEAYKDFDAKPLDDIWNGVKEYLGNGAHKIRIDLGNLTIRYLDGADQVQYVDIAKPDPTKPIDENLLKLIQQVRKAARQVWTDLKFGHNFNDNAARDINGAKPFVIPTDRWKDAMPKNPAQFIEGGHLDQLTRIVGSAGGADREALNKIIEAEAFIKKLKEQTDARIKALEGEINDPKFRDRPVPEQQRVRKSLVHLQEFAKNLDGVDRMAIYFAVGVWGNTDPKTVTQEQRFAKAKQIADGVESTLSRGLKPGEDPRTTDSPWSPAGIWGRMKKLVGAGKPEAETFIGLKPFVHGYAADAGDLAITGKLDLIRRVDQDGDRESGGPSLVDFIAFNIMHTGDPNFDAATALGSLKLGFDQATAAEVVGDVDRARTEATRIRGVAESTHVTNVTDPIGELRQDSELAPILGKASSSLFSKVKPSGLSAASA